MANKIKKRIYRSTKNNATQRGHIHKHRPTYLPHSGPAKTHAWYRRQGLTPPVHRKKKK